MVPEDVLDDDPGTLPLPGFGVSLRRVGPRSILFTERIVDEDALVSENIIE
jgi:hypothetical protein